MWKITLKNLVANKARMSLTGLAVVLGVGFVVASFITADGLRGAFGDLSKDIASGPELVVRQTDEFGVEASINQSTVDAVAAVDGVEAAEGGLSGFVQPIRADGTPVPANGPPLVGVNLTDDAELLALTMTDGRRPGASEFVIDVDSAADHGFEVGQTYDLTTEEGLFTYSLSGLFRFGDENNTLGAVLMGFESEDLRTLIGFDEGGYDEVLVSVADSVTADELAPTIETALADLEAAGLEVVNQQTIEEENAAEFNEVIGIIENVFLGFAAVSLFVSIFIIYNTFGVVLAQRIREIGLLRAVGAESVQIRRGILVEAIGVGLLASIIGVAAGIGLHLGLLRLFAAVGVALPTTSLVVEPRTVIVGLVIGVITTVVSSIGPALKAGRVSVIEALTGSVGNQKTMTVARAGLGLAMLVGGVAVGAIGFRGVGGTAGTIAALAVGAVLVFLAVTLLSPLAAGPVIGGLAVPVRPLAGTAGHLASKNAVRNPRRTATTAGALMVGLSLIAAALVVSESLKAQVAGVIEDSIQADYVIIDPEFNDFSQQVATDVEALPEIGTTLAVGGTRARLETADDPSRDAVSDGVDGADDGVASFNVGDFAALDELLDLGVDNGAIDADSLAKVDNAMILPTETAADAGLSVGEDVAVTFANGQTERFELVATFTDQSIVEGGWLDWSATSALVDLDSVEWVTAAVADGYTAAEAEKAMEAIVVDYPQLNLQSSAQYRESVEAEIDQLINIISMMLALAIIIALLGIGLNLALSVVERTREIGLLRAVGMTRPQTRRMIRWEAAAIAVFGAVLGVATGLLFGWGAVQAIPDTFLTTVSIPVGRLVIMVAVAGVAGLVAAILPARRAGRPSRPSRERRAEPTMVGPTGQESARRVRPRKAAPGRPGPCSGHLVLPVRRWFAGL